MKYLELSLPTPAANLACDEALLEACDAGAGPEILRFWTASEPFVVVGQGNRLAAEVHLDVCRTRRIPVLRRCSGGGTILQTPGCLSYALVLRTELRPELESIRSTNEHILQRHASALQPLLEGGVSAAGDTDLCWQGRKFSGNAQRRLRRAVLFHGTFLLELDLELVSLVLAMPSREPSYRCRRSHREFLTNVPLGADQVRHALARAWEAGEHATHPAATRIDALLHTKYANPAWNEKFF
jgi:lipoate-protein ligase A